MARNKDMLVTDSGISIPAYVTSRTWGGPFGYKTIIDINTTLGAIAGGAALGLGKLIVTLPSEECQVTGSAINVALKQSQGNINADTPVVGLGTTVASGVVSVLSGTAAFQNIMSGQTAADCNGTATVETVTTNLALTTGGVNKTIYVNFAATWAASGDAAAALSGTVTLFWRRMSVA